MFFSGVWKEFDNLFFVLNVKQVDRKPVHLQMFGLPSAHQAMTGLKNMLG